MNIIVDCKENKIFINLLQNFINFDIKSLEIGDILFTYHNLNVLYIERKTINDLASSLNDGRYHEQKARLKSHRVIYLIEENYNKLDKKYHKTFDIEKYKGCIINTMIRDNIHIYLTQNMQESAEFIRDISKRLPKYGDILIGNDKNIFNNLCNEDINYSNSLKTKKKDNMNVNVCFINQLHQIPGVSIIMAQNIADLYKNMAKLIQEYNDYTNTKDIMLRDIKISNRKLGPIVAKRIYEYLFNIT